MVCNKCSIDKPETDYSICLRKDGKIYRRKICKSCKNIERTERALRHRTILREYKANKGCFMCGIADYRVLQFHHLDKASKDFNVGEMIKSGKSLAWIMREVSKCAVVCANCHQLLHYEEVNNQWT